MRPATARLSPDAHPRLAWADPMTHRSILPAPRLAAGLAGLCLLAGGPAAAQGTTQIGGSGAGGSDNVSVNLDVIGKSSRGRQQPRETRRDDDRGTGGSGTLKLSIPGDDGEGDGSQRPEKPEVKPGEVVRGPAGAMLRFPLLEEPESRLTVEMAEFTQREQAPDRQPTEKPPEERAPADEPLVQNQGRNGAADPDGEATTLAEPGDAEPQQETIAARETDPSADRASNGSGADGSGADESGADTGEPASGAADTTREADTSRQADAGGETADDGGPVELQPGEKPGNGADDRERETAATTADDGQEAAGDQPESDRDADRADAGDAPEETQTATRTDATGGALDTQLGFASGSAELGGDTRQRLDRVVEALKNDPNRRIELTAYADAPGDSPSRSRRLSLSRALAVRSYLIEQGVRSTRIDVRALGNAVQDGPADRVDIAPASRG